MQGTKQKVDELLTNMLAGDSYALAQLITLVENNHQITPYIEQAISKFLRRACRVGITGPGGSGKSTLIDSLISIIRGKGLKVGVVAIDPSSAFSGGALLGDRIRMQSHCLDEGVFIRSVATRGVLGGICKPVYTAINLLDAYGEDIILIETTGVGQAEVDIADAVDIVIVIMIPGYGDEIQLMKAGQLEIADIIVINKADKDGAGNLAHDLENVFSLNPLKPMPPIIMVQAINNLGVEELFKEISNRRKIVKTIH